MLTRTEEVPSAGPKAARGFSATALRSAALPAREDVGQALGHEAPPLADSSSAKFP